MSKIAIFRKEQNSAKNFNKELRQEFKKSMPCILLHTLYCMTFSIGMK